MAIPVIKKLTNFQKMALRGKPRVYPKKASNKKRK